MGEGGGGVLLMVNILHLLCLRSAGWYRTRLDGLVQYQPAPRRNLAVHHFHNKDNNNSRPLTLLRDGIEKSQLI